MVQLSNVEKYAIQGMVKDGKTVKEISKELARTEKTVATYLEKLDASIKRLEDNGVVVAQSVPEPPVEEYVPEMARKPPEEEKPKVVSSVPEGLVKKLMINKTSEKGHKAVSIMTPAAAAVSDDAVKSMRVNQRSRTAKGAIYRIDEKEVS